MTEWHPDLETLERFLDDELPEEPSRTLQRHLFTCPGCEARLIEILPSPFGARRWAADGQDLGYRDLFRQVLLEARREGNERRALLSRERKEAGQLWREIRDLGSQARLELVWEDPRFQSWGFFELLVDRSRSAVLEEPRKAEEMLRLALDVTEHLDPAKYGPGSIESAKARAWASLGNVLRVLADFRQAEQAFRQAEAHLASGWLDPLDEALLLEYKASLRRAQRRFGEALEMLDSAISLYREVNEPHGQGRAMMAKGLVLRYSGDAEAASAWFRDSLFLLDGDEEPRLLALSQSNLIGCLLDSGKVHEAAALIPESRKLIEQVGKRSDFLRLRWLEGTVAVTLGQTGAAESIFLEIIDAFAEDRLAYDVALVCLELSAVYARQGRTTDVKRLASKMLPIFKSCEVHREALAALIVFQNAAEAEQLSLGLVEEVSTFLQSVRTNPSLRFRDTP
ncbi:MAG TPA: tetratricopeptide repeat protein [Thermoanaerobaculia bacterium]|jgi:tetratricopeptide (TPR) repeat protein|nr:tetratricopeptide repeat protein [Thermoanaerobaculia bacterium]